MGKEYHVAVVGATGAVGTRMIELLAETSLPIASVRLLASKRSAGQEIQFKGQPLIVEELVPESFEGIDLALFSAGGSISEKFAPEAVKRGAVVVDNTSHFRMAKDVPLVVPEVNPEALKNHQGIIANPNCSTIQMMVALEPIRQAFGLERIIVSTYQAVSGAGIRAINELKEQAEDFLEGKPVSEWSAEILPAASVSAIQELMAQAPGVILQDEPSEQLYPQALNSVNQKETFVGRIRQDVDVKNGFHLWIVSDNLLKGAAWNSVQIAETLHEMNLLRVPEND